MKIIITDEYAYRFPFKRFCKYILDILPRTDIEGIKEIRLANNYSHPESDTDSPACYLGYGDGAEAIIEIHLNNLIKHKIYEYIITGLYEISGLLLSEVLCHEIGHHAFQYKRNNMMERSEEDFVDKYAEAGYYHYLKSRKRRILFEYRYASWSYLVFDSASRKKFKESRKELVNWLDNNNGDIKYP